MGENIGQVDHGWYSHVFASVTLKVPWRYMCPSRIVLFASYGSELPSVYEREGEPEDHEELNEPEVHEQLPSV